MDAQNNAEKSIMPQLVVKIVGGKQIKNFISATKSPTVDFNVTNSSEEKHGHLNKVNDGDLSRKSPSQDLQSLRADEHTENLLAAVRQVSDRQCVTAPCGDRSGSYIHLKTVSATLANLRNTKQLLSQTEAPIKSSLDSWLLSAASEELQDLESQTIHNIGKEVIALDQTHSGTIHQSEMTYLLLKQKIPLKLTTLACLFKSFSDVTNPEQVQYNELLKFIQRAANGKRQSVQAETCGTLVASTDPESVRGRGCMTSEQKETWLQRFQKMEMALQMCDPKKTGYIDRDQAKRLLHNYSLIFDLRLTPMKINEVTRNSQREGKVHMATALQQLKEQ